MIATEPTRKQRVVILGSTGSVGVNTLDVIAMHPQRFEVFALSASRQVDLLLGQCVRYKPEFAVIDRKSTRLNSSH